MLNYVALDGVKPYIYESRWLADWPGWSAAPCSAGRVSRLQGIPVGVDGSFQLSATVYFCGCSDRLAPGRSVRENAVAPVAVSVTTSPWGAAKFSLRLMVCGMPRLPLASVFRYPWCFYHGCLYSMNNCHLGSLNAAESCVRLRLWLLS